MDVFCFAKFHLLLNVKRIKKKKKKKKKNEIETPARLYIYLKIVLIHHLEPQHNAN